LIQIGKFSNGVSPEDFKDLKQELAHSLTESLPIIPENYEPLEETYYLQKNELYQFLEKNLNFISIDKKKILDTHSSFYKGFMSLMQHSRNQSQRVPSENRIMNYKTFDKPLPEKVSMINGIAKPNYFPPPPQPNQMNIPKPNNEMNEMNVEKNPSRNLKTPPYNNFLNMPPPDYSMQKYQTYPYRKENSYTQIQNFNKPIATPNYPGQQIMTRSIQGQPQQYNHQFLALRNNYNVYQDPNMPNVNVYGNQMKITHNLNPNLYNFPAGYTKYPQNLYINNNSSMRMNNNNINNGQNDQNSFADENLGKYHEEQPTYKNFNYLGDHISKKINTSFYPNNNNEHLYYKNLEMTRENNEYMNGFTNPEINRHSFNMNSEENLNDFQNFEKKKNENKMELEENYLVGDNDEFKIKRINSLSKFNGQKQIDDFLAINQESKVEGTPPELANNRIFS